MPETNTPPRPIPNTYWVVPSRLLAGEYPGDKGVAAARAKLRALLQGGVTHFVDLTRAGELVAYDALLREEARGLGVSAVYERHPIADISVPQTPGEMAAILDTIDAAVDVGGMVYVHLSRAARRCTAGVSKFRENVRLSVQQKCHSVKPQWYQMMTLRKPRGIVALADPQRPCIS